MCLLHLHRSRKAPEHPEQVVQPKQRHTDSRHWHRTQLLATLPPLPWQIVMTPATSQRCTRAMDKIDTASGATERCTELATQGEMRPAWRYAGVRRAGNRRSHDARSPGNLPEE